MMPVNYFNFKVKSLFKQKHGFTLAEVLIAIIILSVGITSAIKGMQNIMQVSSYAKKSFYADLFSSHVLFALHANPSCVEDKEVVNKFFDEQEEELFKNCSFTLNPKELSFLGIENFEFDVEEIVDDAEYAEDLIKRAEISFVRNETVIKYNERPLLKIFGIYNFYREEDVE